MFLCHYLVLDILVNLRPFLSFKTEKGSGMIYIQVMLTILWWMHLPKGGDNPFFPPEMECLDLGQVYTNMNSFL